MATSKARKKMVRTQISDRGIIDEAILRAMESVPREAFVPEYLKDRAYQDGPLPIGSSQTISQPYIVAYMIEALKLSPEDRFLEIGTGSGYAAAVLAEIVAEVFTIERHEELASTAREVLAKQGYQNVTVVCGDGTLGLAGKAPFDAIVVTAGGPNVPHSLSEQLSIGGRLVIPVGPAEILQNIYRIHRTAPNKFEQEDLVPVRFVPLIGQEGWQGQNREAVKPEAQEKKSPEAISQLITKAAEPFETIHQANLDPLLERIGDKRIVLLGEASHGTSQFYAMRAQISKELIEKKGFSIIAAEADWPDAARIDHYIQHRSAAASKWEAFSRFPTWMWRNEDVRAFVDWLHQYNADQTKDKRSVGFYGLDLYSLFASIDAVISYLKEVDPEAAKVAIARYSCLSPWHIAPEEYGRAALAGGYEACADAIASMLIDIREKHAEYAAQDGNRFLDASQNAQARTPNWLPMLKTITGPCIWTMSDRGIFATSTCLKRFAGY